MFSFYHAAYFRSHESKLQAINHKTESLVARNFLCLRRNRSRPWNSTNPFEIPRQPQHRSVWVACNVSHFTLSHVLIRFFTSPERKVICLKPSSLICVSRILLHADWHLLRKWFNLSSVSPGRRSPRDMKCAQIVTFSLACEHWIRFHEKSLREKFSLGAKVDRSKLQNKAKRS